MTNTLARNMAMSAVPLYDIAPPQLNLEASVFSTSKQFLGVCEIFQYNYSMTEEFFRAVKSKKWVISVIHGFCKHISITIVIQISSLRGLFLIWWS